MNEKIFPIVERYTSEIFKEKKNLKNLEIKVELKKKIIKHLEEEKKIVLELDKNLGKKI